jgi:hypothetical protein
MNRQTGTISQMSEYPKSPPIRDAVLTLPGPSTTAAVTNAGPMSVRIRVRFIE